MDNCIFCRIINKEIPAEIVFEDSESVAFMDINPVNYGHLLLIPKKHFPYIADVPDDLLGRMFVKTKMLMGKLKDATNADYVINSVVGLDVPHFHIHIIPRYHNDGLARFWPVRKYSDDEMKKVAEKIRKFI